MGGCFFIQISKRMSAVWCYFTAVFSGFRDMFFFFCGWICKFWVVRVSGDEIGII